MYLQHQHQRLPQLLRHLRQAPQLAVSVVVVTIATMAGVLNLGTIARTVAAVSFAERQRQRQRRHPRRSHQTNVTAAGFHSTVAGGMMALLAGLCAAVILVEVVTVAGWASMAVGAMMAPCAGVSAAAEKSLCKAFDVFFSFFLFCFSRKSRLGSEQVLFCSDLFQL